MLYPRFNREKGAGDFPGVPFIAPYRFSGDPADKYGRSGSGLTAPSISTDLFTTVELQQLQRNSMKTAYYKNTGVIKSKWICLRVSTYFMTTQHYLKNIFDLLSFRRVLFVL